MLKKLKEKKLNNKTSMFLNLLIIATLVLVLSAIFILWSYIGIFSKVLQLCFVLLVPPFIAFLFATIFQPIMNFFVKVFKNRTVSAAICTAIAEALFVGAIFAVIWAIFSAVKPIDINTINTWIAKIEEYIEWLNENSFFNIELEEGLFVKLVQLIQSSDLNLSTVFSFLGSLYSVIGSLTIILTIFPFYMFFMLRNPNIVKSGFRKIVPKKWEGHYDELSERFERVSRGYIAGTFYESFFMLLILMVIYYIIGLILLIAGITPNPFLTWAPLLFGLIMAVMQIVPYVGAAIGALPPLIYCFIVYYPIGLLWVFLVVLVVNVVAQLVIDNLLLRPWLLGKAISVHPLMLITGMLLASVLFGFWGILLSVVIIGFVKEAVMYVYKVNKDEKTSSLVLAEGACENCAGEHDFVKENAEKTNTEQEGQN